MLLSTRTNRRLKDLRRHHRQRSRSTLRCEILEQRRVLAAGAIVVTTLADTLADDGLISLREAIQETNAGTNDEIIFAPELTSGGPATITLSGTQLEITSSVTINGPGDDLLTIDADGQSRIFFVSDGDESILSDVAIGGLTLTGGSAPDGTIPSENSGGAIAFLENLSILDSTITGSSAAGFGGGFFGYNPDAFDPYAPTEIATSLNIVGSTITGNNSGASGGGIQGDCAMLGNLQRLG